MNFLDYVNQADKNSFHLIKIIYPTRSTQESLIFLKDFYVWFQIHKLLILYFSHS